MEIKNINFTKKIWDNRDELEIEKNKYYIMLDLEEKELKKISKKDKVVEKYMGEIVRVNNSPEFQVFMTYEEDQEKIFNSRMKEAKKIANETGIKKGIKQGIEKGKYENSVLIAKKLKSMGLELDKISLATNLSLTQLNKIL